MEQAKVSLIWKHFTTAYNKLHICFNIFKVNFSSNAQALVSEAIKVD